MASLSQTRFPHLSDGVRALPASQGRARSQDCAEPTVRLAVHPGQPLGPVLATPMGTAAAKATRRVYGDQAAYRDSSSSCRLLSSQDCSVYKDIPCCRTCLLIALFWFQSWGRKYMLLPVDPSPWSGCQQQGWVGGAEGSRPLPSALAPCTPAHSRRIWSPIQRSLSRWKSELSGGSRGWWGGRNRVSVSLNALCVSVIRNLMALSEIPKLYLAG